MPQLSRLFSYLLSDQFERLNRIRGAIDRAATANFTIDAVKATDWLGLQYDSLPKIRPRVFYHSII